jgi:hypothetical protein
VGRPLLALFFIDRVPEDRFRLFADRGEDQVLHRAGYVELRSQDTTDRVSRYRVDRAHLVTVATKRRLDLSGKFFLLFAAPGHGVEKRIQ